MRKITAVFLAMLMLMLAGCAKKPAQTTEEAQTETVNPAQQTEKDDTSPRQSGEIEILEEEFISAQCVSELPEGVTLVTADENGSYILLETVKELPNLWISRIEYDAAQQDYVSIERLWWQNKWEAGGKLALEMEITKEHPALEISWEDEFGQRDRRLIEFKRVFAAGTKEETVSLLYFIPPLQPTNLMDYGAYYYDMNVDGSKEVIRFTRPEKTKGEALMAALQITQGSTVYEYHLLLQSDCKCYLADLNEDYQAELYISGKTEDGTVLTYPLQLSEVGIVSVPLAEEIAQKDADAHTVLRGGIENIEKRVLYLSDTAYVFSHPYTAHCSYGYSGGQLESVSGIWTLDTGRNLEVKLGLPVLDEDGEEQTLAIGTKLRPVQSDLVSFVTVQTSDDKSYKVLFTQDQDGTWIIGGYLPDELLK